MTLTAALTALRTTALGVLLLGAWSTAAAEHFDLPHTMSGLTRTDSGHGTAQVSDLIDRAVRQSDMRCGDVGLYTYTDAAQATTDLRDWLTSRGLQATEHDHTDTFSLWIARTGEDALFGEWFAPTASQPGRLELCDASPLHPRQAQAQSGGHLHLRTLESLTVGILRTLESLTVGILGMTAGAVNWTRNWTRQRRDRRHGDQQEGQ